MSNTPPPLPTAVAFHPTAPPLIAQAARASWIAPLVAVVLNCLTGREEQTPHSTLMIMAAARLLIIGLGMVFTLVALYGLIVKRYRDILGYTIAGAIVNALVLAAMIIMLTVVRPVMSQQAQAQARQQAIKAAEDEGRDGFLGYDGWFGLADVGGGRAVLTQIGDDSAMIVSFRHEFTKPFSVIVLSFENSTSRSAVKIDAATTVLHFGDGHTVPAVPGNEVVMTARTDRNRWMDMVQPQITVQPGTQLKGYQIFIPERLDLTNLRSVQLTINGQPVDIPGRIFTTAEKKQLVEKGQQKTP